MIHEEICTYEVAKLAKKKGFNEYAACNHIYEDDEQWYTLTTYTNAKGIDWSKDKFTVASTQSLLQRWLREEKNIHIEIVATASGYFWIADKINGTAITDSDILDRGINEGGCWDIYEQALEDALKYSLENLV